MKKRILIAAGILLLVCAAGAGGWYYFHEKENTAAAEGETAYVSSISSIMGLSTGTSNRYAGVVEPQETVEVNIENGRKVTKVEVKSGDVVTQGQLLFEYDLSSIQEDLQEAKLELDRLKNEARSLTAQIETLEAEKEEASEDNLLSYTIEIETSRMNLQKNTYQQTSKEAEIQKLQNATGNTEVRSPIDGIIQKIDTSKLSNDSGDSLDESGTDTYYSAAGNGESNAFITILSTGAYRVKGSVNEQNKEQVMMMEGMPVIIRSRVDENQTWNGIMGKIDQENASSGSSAMMYGMMDASGSQTSSSTYPFYVSLENSEGLMLGQHVYIERDDGQGEKKEGLWLSDYYIVDADKENPYVWAANDKNRLEKRQVILGSHDDALAQYEIVDGVTASDKIAFPTEGLLEGMTTVVGDGTQMGGMDAGAAASADVQDEAGETPVSMDSGDGASAETAAVEEDMGDPTSEVTVVDDLDESMDNAQIIEDDDMGDVQMIEDMEDIPMGNAPVIDEEIPMDSAQMIEDME